MNPQPQHPSYPQAPPSGYPPNPQNQAQYGWSGPWNASGQPGAPPPYPGGQPPNPQNPGGYPPHPQYPHQYPSSQPNSPPSNNMYGSYGGDPEAPLHGGDTGAFLFSEKTIRMAFIRKVFGILMCQLAVTVAFIALFVYEPRVKGFAHSNPWLWWLTFGLTFALLITLACCDGLRRRWPTNIILLGLFTMCEGFMLGFVSSVYEKDEVLMAMGICTAVCLALTIFAMQTKWDFTMMGGILFVCCVILMIFGIVAIFVQNRVVSLVYSSIGAVLFSIYLVFDVQLMLGGKHKYSISPEEYIFAALNLYLDIINIFLYILAIIGGSRRD